MRRAIVDGLTDIGKRRARDEVDMWNVTAEKDLARLTRLLEGAAP